MTDKKARFAVRLKFNLQKELDRFLNVHLPFEVEIEDRGEPKPKRSYHRAAKTPAARPATPTD